MRLDYGSYSHDDDEVWFDTSKSVVLSKRNRRRSIVEQWTIWGIKHAASQSALTSALNTMRDAYAIDDQDLLFYDNSGALTTHGVRVSETLHGVKVRRLDFVSMGAGRFGVGAGDDYVTRKKFRLVIQAEVADSSAENLLEYRESVTQYGTGGPRRLWVTSLTGSPQAQVPVQKTTFRAVQRGYAIGLLGYPTPPASLFSPSVTVSEAEEGGVENAIWQSPVTDTGFKINWKYVAESPSILT